MIRGIRRIGLRLEFERLRRLGAQNREAPGTKNVVDKTAYPASDALSGRENSETRFRKAEHIVKFGPDSRKREPSDRDPRAFGLRKRHEGQQVGGDLNQI